MSSPAKTPRRLHESGAYDGGRAAFSRGPRFRTSKSLGRARERGFRKTPGNAQYEAIYTHPDLEPPAVCFRGDDAHSHVPGAGRCLDEESGRRQKTFDLISSAEKELFWIENTTKRFRDGYNHFEKHPEKVLGFFDKEMNEPPKGRTNDSVIFGYHARAGSYQNAFMGRKGTSAIHSEHNLPEGKLRREMTIFGDRCYPL